MLCFSVGFILWKNGRNNIPCQTSLWTSPSPSLAPCLQQVAGDSESRQETHVVHPAICSTWAGVEEESSLWLQLPLVSAPEHIILSPLLVRRRLPSRKLPWPFLKPFAISWVFSSPPRKIAVSAIHEQAARNCSSHVSPQGCLLVSLQTQEEDWQMTPTRDAAEHSHRAKHS